MARRSSAARTVSIVVVALAATWLAAALGWIAPITRPFVRAYAALLAPVHRAADSIAAGDDVPLDDLDEAELRRRLERALAENARLRVTAEETDELKAALDYRERFAETPVQARVISSVRDPLDTAVIIDRGERDGVRVGQPVVTGDGVLVGKVVTAGPHVARVRLLSDSRSAVAVSLQNATGTLGVLQGDRGIGLRVSLIPQSEVLTPGDTVITSGLEPGVKRGLLVGTVEKVERGVQDPFQTALIVPFADAARPAFVQVLVPPSGL